MRKTVKSYVVLKKRLCQSILMISILMILITGSTEAKTSYYKNLGYNNEGKIVRIDLNGDGKKEQIVAKPTKASSYRYAVYINKKRVIANVREVILCDFNNKDRYIELIVTKDEKKYKMYRYKSGKLKLFAAGTTKKVEDKKPSELLSLYYPIKDIELSSRKISKNVFDGNGKIHGSLVLYFRGTDRTFNQYIGLIKSVHYVRNGKFVLDCKKTYKVYPVFSTHYLPSFTWGKTLVCFEKVKFEDTKMKVYFEDLGTGLKRWGELPYDYVGIYDYMTGM